MEELTDKESSNNANSDKCAHNAVLSNVTLAGGIKSGVFTSHGMVHSFDDCLQQCCKLPFCDAAFMVKRTCFSLRCSSSKLCKTRKARPSTYHPMVSFLKRFDPSEEIEGMLYFSLSLPSYVYKKCVAKNIGDTGNILYICQNGHLNDMKSGNKGLLYVRHFRMCVIKLYHHRH